jgi:UDP-hydrolysing UDP-N-acetyl-D-glucosamine 2-epimerase
MWSVSKRKICVVLTARTSYTKIKPILQAISNRDDLELQIVCAASAVLPRYGSTDAMVERDGFKIDERVFMLVEGETLLTSAKSVGLGIVEFSGAFARLSPDVVLVMADRYEIMAPAIAASYQNIPLAHVQGGEVTGNIDEKVRHAVTKLDDLHFPATEMARARIIQMGENPDAVYWTGCPSIDIASDVLENPELDFDLYKRYGGVGAFPDLSSGYYIVMQHPVTTEYEQARSQVEETFHAMAQVDKPVLWFWPNVDAGSDDVSKAIRVFRENQKPTHMHFIKNMAPQDFLRVLNKSLGIIGNSSVAIREASYLGVPAVNIGTRQKARERAENVKDVSYNRDEILAAVRAHCGEKFASSHLYGNGQAGQSIADILGDAQLTISKTLCV